MKKNLTEVKKELEKELDKNKVKVIEIITNETQVQLMEKAFKARNGY